MINTHDLQSMDYRILFVRFQREAKSTYVNVLLDGWHLTHFYSEALSEEEFIEECQTFTVSEKYQLAIANKGA